MRQLCRYSVTKHVQLVTNVSGQSMIWLPVPYEKETPMVPELDEIGSVYSPIRVDDGAGADARPEPSPWRGPGARRRVVVGCREPAVRCPGRGTKRAVQGVLPAPAFATAAVAGRGAMAHQCS